MTTDKTPATLAVDVLAVMDQAIEREKDAGQAYVAQEAARAAVALLIEAAERMRDVIHANGCYDDGAFYYFGLSSPELERPLSGIDSALARVKGESA